MSNYPCALKYNRKCLPNCSQSDAFCADNVAQLVGIGGVEPSASVTAPVRSLLLNSGAGQIAVQPVPQVPFPMYTDPFQYELEKLRRESENVKKTFEEKVSCPQYPFTFSFDVFFLFCFLTGS